MRSWLVLLILSALVLVLVLSPAPAWAKKDDPAGSKTGEGKKEEKEEDHKGESVFKGWLDLTVYSIIVFLGLLFILTRYAWKPMLQGLEKREADIAAAVEEAKKAKEEATQLRASLQQEKDKALADVNALIARAREDAEALKGKLVAEAEATIASERERFQRDVTTARDQALHDLWSQAAELASLVSSKVIRRQLTPEDHRALVDEALGELKQAAQRHKGNGSST